MRIPTKRVPAFPALIVLCCTGALHGATLTAQEGTPATPDAATTTAATADAQEADDALKALQTRVAKAHGTADRDAPIDRFRAAIRITPAQKSAERIEVDLTAAFLAPDRLRYRVQEQGKDLERGQDSKGMWTRDGDRIVAMDRGEEARQFATDRRTLAQHVRLARQLVAFLDPATMLGELEDVSDVEDTTFRLGKRGRGLEIDATSVEGTLDSFPLFVPATDGNVNARVRLRLWFARDTGLLAAARAIPIREDGRVGGAPETYLLREYQAVDGLQLPLSLLIFRGGGVEPVREAEIGLRSIDLDQKLDPRSLERDWR